MAVKVMELLVIQLYCMCFSYILDPKASLLGGNITRVFKGKLHVGNGSLSDVM